MSRTTFQNSLAEVFGVLAADAAGTPEAALVTAGCKRVYDVEPGASGWLKPCSMTVAPEAIDPEFWMIAVRVYVDDQYGARAQDLLVDVTVAADSLLKAGEGYGPSRWALGWQPDLSCWLATTSLMVGREDGF